MNSSKLEIDEDLMYKVLHFLNRVGDGYLELSYAKVEGEYRYYKSKAKELKYEVANAIASNSSDD